MTDVPDLFLSPKHDDCEAYKNLASDAPSDNAKECRTVAEKLWRQYHPYADSQFLIEIRKNFHARFWEMYLTCALLKYAPSNCYSLTCPKPGPDIRLEHEGRVIWIEAVVATDGTPGRADSITAPELNVVSTVPDEKIILRYTNALTEKNKKYLCYLSNGIIKKDDAFIVAVNGSPLSYRWADAEMPRILKAVFPIGPLAIAIREGKAESVQHLHRPLIVKEGGQSVST